MTHWFSGKPTCVLPLKQLRSGGLLSFSSDHLMVYSGENCYKSSDADRQVVIQMVHHRQYVLFLACCETWIYCGYLSASWTSPLCRKSMHQAMPHVQDIQKDHSNWQRMRLLSTLKTVYHTQLSPITQPITMMFTTTLIVQRTFIALSQSIHAVAQLSQGIPM